jgi:hypothetical protein
MEEVNEFFRTGFKTCRKKLFAIKSGWRLLNLRAQR